MFPYDTKQLFSALACQNEYSFLSIFNYIFKNKSYYEDNGQLFYINIQIILQFYHKFLSIILLPKNYFE